MRKISTIALMSASLIAIGGTQSAFAQQAPAAAAEEDAAEGEIIVTARRKDENLQQVPLTVQAVTGENLAKLELRSFQDVTAIVPGLQLTRSANGVQNTVQLRGVFFTPTAAGPQTAVELYRNDVVTTASAIFQALYDVGQIEVLRGPQGTLRGRATPSGAITITTRKPDLSQIGAYFSGSIAEGGKRTGEGALNIPVVEDKVAVRVAGFLSEDKLPVVGFNRFTNTENDDVNDETESLRASVRVKPFDDVLTLDFNYETTKRNGKSFQQVESRNYVDGVALTGGVPDISTRDRYGIQVLPVEFDGTFKYFSWQGDLKLAGQRLVYVGGRTDAVNVSLVPEDFGGFLANPSAPPLDVDAANRPPVGSVIHPFGQLSTSEQHQRFHEVRLQSNERIAGIFDYVIGYMNLKSNTPTLLYTTQTRCNGGATNCAVGGLASMVRGGTLRLRNDQEKSFFGNVTVHLGDRTEFSGGARRISYAANAGLQSAARNASQLLLFDQEPLAILQTRTPVASFNQIDRVKKTIYTFSAKHEFSDNFMVYGTYGTAFRPGNLIVCARCNAAQGTALNAAQFLRQPDETSNSAEIGFKSSFLDKRATFNATLFQQKFKNFAIASAEQIPFLGTFTAGTPPTGTLAGFNNTFGQPNNVKVTGVEAEFSFKASDRFNFGGNFAYAKSIARNGRVPCIDLNNDGFSDTVLPSAADANTLAAQTGPGLVDTCPITRASPAPRLTATLQSEYNVPVGFGQAYLRGLLTYNGKTIGEEVNPVDSVGSYALINAYLGVRDEDGGWDLSVFARNLTNTNRVLSRSGSRATSVINGVNYVSQYYNISTTAPREFGVNLRVALGSK